jgi:hypothetical protein
MGAEVIIRTKPSLDVSDIGSDTYSQIIVSVVILAALVGAVLLLGRVGG